MAVTLRHFSRSLAWVGAGQSASILGQLVGIRVLTELVPPAEFGQFNLLLGASVLFLAMLGSPLMLALQRFYSDSARDRTIPQLRSTVAAMLWRRITIAWGLAGLAVVGMWIAGGHAKAAAFLLTALLTIEVLRLFELTCLNAAHLYREYAIWQGVEAWLRPATAIVLIKSMESSAEVLLAAYALATCACYLGARLLIRRNSAAPSAITADPLLRNDISRYALPLMPYGLVVWISGMADRYVIGTLLPWDQVGLYSAVYSLASRPMLVLSEIADTVIRPHYYDAVAAQNRRLQNRYLAAWFIGMLGAIAVALLAVSSFHALIGSIFLGSAYRDATYLMPWIVGGYGFLAFSQLTQRICLAHHASSRALTVTMTGALLSLAIGIPLIYAWGIWGAAVAVPSAFAGQFLFSVGQAWPWLRPARAPVG